MKNTIRKFDAARAGVNQGGWMYFMQYVDEHFPFVLRRGRPTPALVQKSLIGRSGWSSWMGFVNADRAAGGLGWSTNGWREWRRAWRLVERHPYLWQFEISPATINSVDRSDHVFPCDYSSFQYHFQRIAEGRVTHSPLALITENEKLREEKEMLSERRRALADAYRYLMQFADKKHKEAAAEIMSKTKVNE